VDLQVAPEQPAEGSGDGTQGGVVEIGGSLGEVLDQQVPDGPALDAVGGDICSTLRRPSSRSTRNRSGAAAGSTPAFFSIA